MPFTPKVFVALAGDALAVKALGILKTLDPKIETLTIREALPADRPGSSLAVLFTHQGDARIPGNHLRVLRADDADRPAMRRFVPPEWTRRDGTVVPVHQCVALRPRHEGEDDELFAEALATAHNTITGGKLKVPNRRPVGHSCANHSSSRFTRRDSDNPATMGVRA